jgi:poly(3-hydroxybutyrate) depolymerase
MKPFLLLALALLCCGAASAQNYCATDRYDTTEIFPSGSLTGTTVTYGVNTDWHGQTDSLSMLIYRPSNGADTATKRPFILLIHGGGFVSGTLNGMKQEAIYFARRGFVAGTIDYRLGWNQECIPNNTSQTEAIYRASQDARAALRWVVANASALRVDTAMILMFGRSAGAVNCLVTWFNDQADFEAAEPGIVSILGPLDSGSNNLTDHYTIKAIASVSGGVSDTALITPGTMIPIAMFQGTADSVIPYKTGHPYNCEDFPVIQGSYEIARQIRRLGGCFELCFEPGIGHGHVYEGQDSFFFPQLSHFFKRVLCSDCRQIIYRNQTLLQDSAAKFDLPEIGGEAPEIALTVTPSVTSGTITVEARGAGVADGTIEISDIQGRLLLTENAGSELRDISLAQYPAGHYFITCRTAFGSVTRHILLER